MTDNATLHRKINDTKGRITALAMRLKELEDEVVLECVKRKEYLLERKTKILEKYHIKHAPTEKCVKAVINALQCSDSDLTYVELSEKTGYGESHLSTCCVFLEKEGIIKREKFRYGRIKFLRVSLVNKKNKEEE